MSRKNLSKSHQPKTVTLPEHSKITQELVNQLDSLITFSSPGAFRKSILTVYLQYIICEHEALPIEFEEIACDFNMLIDFFTRAEEEMR